MVGAVVEATLKRITFANAQTGYTVARVDPGRGGDLVTVVGRCWAPDRGDAAAARTVESASAVRPAVPVEDYTTVLPATAQGIRRYLGPGVPAGSAGEAAVGSIVVLAAALTSGFGRSSGNPCQQLAGVVAVVVAIALVHRDSRTAGMV